MSRVKITGQIQIIILTEKLRVATFEMVIVLLDCDSDGVSSLDSSSSRFLNPEPELSATIRRLSLSLPPDTKRARSRHQRPRASRADPPRT